MSKVLVELFEKKKGMEEYSSKIKNTVNTNGEKLEVKNIKGKRYDAVSKNGDTLELSDVGKAMEKDGGKILDSTLSGYSESKLKQLYIQKTITKQQYDKAMEKRKDENATKK